MNLDVYLIEFLPLILMGLLCGFVRFARGENELINDKDCTTLECKLRMRRTRFLRGVDVVLTSTITGFIVYACLSHFTDFDYIIRIAISAAVALYGVDKILDFAHKLIALKKEARQ